MTQDNSKQTALKLVRALAPDEEPLFDGMWTDYRQNQSIDEADVSDRQQGIGGVEEITLLSSIIIPLVVAFSSKLITNAADDLYKYIKAKITGVKNQDKSGMTDDDILELATKISEKLKQ